MKITTIESVMAQRILYAGEEKILVCLGAPKPFDDGNDFYCAYSIEYKGSKKYSYAGGVDSIQSIQLALKKISVDLFALGKKESVVISWLPDSVGDTGF